MNTFSINQIVKGTVCGTFVILGFRQIDGESYVQVKQVNPVNHDQTAPGEIALPLGAIQPLY